ncbi:MAG TPA: hypothetical protein VEU33_27140 [Archangium sp.]|nr:hypothetical protein [Archangium sp.]
MRIAVLAAALATLVAPSASAAQHGLNLTIYPYFSSNYGVGLTATWQAVPGAAKYIVSHYRQDMYGSATVIHETTGLGSSTGRFPNYSGESGCYKFETTVKAVSASGVVLAEAKGSFCETGYP